MLPRTKLLTVLNSRLRPSSGVLRVLFTGQSNIGGLFSQTTFPPAAASGTSFWSDTRSLDAITSVIQTTVPSANGIREYANAMRLATGKEIQVANGSTGGTTADYFDPDNGMPKGYTNALALIDAMGEVDALVVQIGEGDANAIVLSEQDRKDGWKLAMANFHEGIEAYVGHNVPMIIASLATFGGTDNTTDETWWTIQEAIREFCNAGPRRYFSHSNMDADRTDAYHYTATFYGEDGKRFAATSIVALGLGVDTPAWYITAVDAISTTTTRLTVAHAEGTDFTPTSSISGFEVSEDNATFIAATGARVDATHILLTHAALTYPLAYPDDRYLRFDYGVTPDVTNIPKDNSALQVPLTLSASQLLVDYANPVMTSPISPSVTEDNGTFIQTLTATRASTYAIGGTDAAQCQVLSGNELHWVSARDYASPADSGGNNVYDITVTPTASDNGDVGAAQSVAVTVTSAVAKVFHQGEYKGQGATLVSGTVDIGAATSDRFILFGGWNQNAQATDPVVTIAGTVLSKLVEVEGGEWTGFYGGLVTAGSGSQAYSIQFSPDIGFLGDAFVAIWSIKGLVSTTPAATGTVNHASSLTVAAGDFLFIVRASGGSSEALSNSPTQAPDRQQEISGGGYWRMFDVDWTIAASSGAFAPGLDTTGINGVFVRMK